MKTLLDYLEAGDSLDEFLDNFPSVKREQAIAAIEEAEAIAQQLGLSLNELHRKAMKAYLQKYSRIEILEKLNQIYSEESSELDPAIAKMQFMSLPREEW